MDNLHSLPFAFGRDVNTDDVYCDTHPSGNLPILHHSYAGDQTVDHLYNHFDILTQTPEGLVQGGFLPDSGYLSDLSTPAFSPSTIYDTSGEGAFYRARTTSQPRPIANMSQQGFPYNTTRYTPQQHSSPSPYQQHLHMFDGDQGYIAVDASSNPHMPGRGHPDLQSGQAVGRNVHDPFLHMSPSGNAHSQYGDMLQAAGEVHQRAELLRRLTAEQQSHAEQAAVHAVHEKAQRLRYMDGVRATGVPRIQHGSQRPIQQGWSPSFSLPAPPLDNSQNTDAVERSPFAPHGAPTLRQMGASPTPSAQSVLKRSRTTQQHLDQSVPQSKQSTSPSASPQSSFQIEPSGNIYGQTASMQAEEPPRKRVRLHPPTTQPAAVDQSKVSPTKIHKRSVTKPQGTGQPKASPPGSDKRLPRTERPAALAATHPAQYRPALPTSAMPTSVSTSSSTGPHIAGFGSGVDVPQTPRPQGAKRGSNFMSPPSASALWTASSSQHRDVSSPRWSPSRPQYVDPTHQSSTRPLKAQGKLYGMPVVNGELANHGGVTSLVNMIYLPFGNAIELAHIYPDAGAKQMGDGS